MSLQHSWHPPCSPTLATATHGDACAPETSQSPEWVGLSAMRVHKEINNVAGGCIYADAVLRSARQCVPLLMQGSWGHSPYDSPPRAICGICMRTAQTSAVTNPCLDSSNQSCSSVPWLACTLTCLHQQQPLAPGSNAQVPPQPFARTRRRDRLIPSKQARRIKCAFAVK